MCNLMNLTKLILLFPIFSTSIFQLNADLVTFDNERNYFIDSEDAGRLRVGAVWGIPGLYAEDGKNLVLGAPINSSVYLGNAANFVTIKGDGNVGIGTTSPSGKLHIKNPNDGAGQYSGLRFFPAKPIDQASNPSEDYHRLLGFRRKGLWIGGSENGSTYTRSNILMNDSGVFFGMSDGYLNPENNVSLALINSGNVGIGTTTPENKLDVNGTIRAKEVIVETNWSDFVFADEYKLRSLSEVEEHINQHGHLPDVPSAESIQSEGLSVGESQTIMMQKIEELTLYVIELKKQNDSLQNQIKELRNH